jgi:hypothetical protein
MMEPGVPVFDRRDAEIYGWRFEPGKNGDLWLRVIDGRGAICFPPGTHITHSGNGDMTMSQTVQVIDLEGSVDSDGSVWLSDGVVATDEKVEPTRNIHAIIFAPGGFVRWEGDQILSQGIEFAGVPKPGASEPSA